MLQQTIDQLTINPKRLFLLDGLGALLSAFMLGVILVKFNAYIGMPLSILYFLAVLPCFFAVFDFCCYFKLSTKWSVFIMIIAVLNLIYCVISFGFLILHYPDLTTLGKSYFILELIILIILIFIELKVAKQLKTKAIN